MNNQMERKAPGCLIFNSNKAMVSYLLKKGCKVREVKIGRKDTILFGFDKDETQVYVDEWMNAKDHSLVDCKSNQGVKNNSL